LQCVNAQHASGARSRDNLISRNALRQTVFQIFPKRRISAIDRRQLALRREEKRKKICEEAAMTIETVNTAATERPRQFARCAQCGSTLVVPEWSERLGERCVRYLWSCDACGYGFETSVYFPKE